MIEVAPGRGQHGEALEAQLADMEAVPVRQPGQAVGRHDAGVAAPEEELAFSEGTLGEDTQALRAGGPRLDISDHATSGPGSASMDGGSALFPTKTSLARIMAVTGDFHGGGDPSMGYSRERVPRG